MTDNSMIFYAGVDLGGTKIAMALGTSNGKLLGKASYDTAAEMGPEHVLGSIAEMLHRLEDSAGIRARSIGIGLPGLVDPLAGTSLFLPNLGWLGFRWKWTRLS